jgi:ABC-2 type transport system permease protein
MLAVLVNVLGWPSAVNAVTLLAVWLAVVIVVPSTVNVLALRLYPAPSRVELIQALRRATDAADTRAAQLLGRYFQDHPDLVPASANASMSDFYSRTMAVQADAEEATRPIMTHFAAQTDAQRRLVDRFQFLSPAVLVRNALDDLAGTGETRYRDFISQTGDYHAEWRAFFMPRIMRQSKMTAADYDQIPVFRYVAEADERVRGRVWQSVTGLVVPLAAMIAVSVLFIARYRLGSEQRAVRTTRRRSSAVQRGV